MNGLIMNKRIKKKMLLKNRSLASSRKRWNAEEKRQTKMIPLEGIIISETEKAFLFAPETEDKTYLYPRWIPKSRTRVIKRVTKTNDYIAVEDWICERNFRRPSNKDKE